MAVSLGMRISGLLFVGAVAVAAAAFTGDVRGRADGRGGGDTTVTAAPTTGPRAFPSSGLPSSFSPLVRPRPEGHVGAPASTGTPSASEGGAETSAPASPSPSPSVTRQLLEVPDWLPPGPDSPNADGTDDAASVYDLLRDPGECRAALAVVPGLTADADRALLRGLATACLAVQGEGGDWEQAARDHAALADGAGSCKGRAAYAVLGGLLDFHRRHPEGTVRLKPTSGGTPACGYRIAGVDTGGDGTAKPGEVIGIELADEYFDPAELLRDGIVSVGGLPVPVLQLGTGDRASLSVVVPVLEPGPVAVTVRYGGTEVRLPDAFEVAASDVVPDPDTGTPAVPATPLSASGPPELVLPLGPVLAHRPGAHAPAGLRIP
ncbi:hypothetical protein [Streptomyces lanatus]|uniref:Secreted protein n=1 Tax=Streptomyces lanatus TaxID=66900 RepID=A0ABV1XYR4_9ACTN|nr:hypothetical protein [Streptomyces lanatus]GHH18640.1 hypothetical protein GCM10018780_63370 [Streptomyces lanatus]